MGHGLLFLNRWRIGFVLIIGLAILTRFWNIGHLPLVVFDEVYYTTMATQYLAGTPFIDRHGPGARFIFAALAYVARADASARFEKPITPYGDFPYTLLRMGSATAGVLVVALVMLIGKDATRMPLAGLFAGVLTVFENTLTLLSRYIMGDVFVLLFGLAGLWCYLKKNQVLHGSRAWYGWLGIAGICFGLALSTKMIGGLFLATTWFLFMREEKEQRPSPRTARIFLILLPILVVVGLMTLHFSLLNTSQPVLNVIGTTHPPTVTFFDALRSSEFGYQFGGSYGLLTQRGIEITVGSLLTVAGHLGSESSDLDSPVWMWPFLEKPVPMMILKDEEYFSIIHLLGNPAVWWGGLLALVYALIRRFGYGEVKVLDPFLFGYSFNLAILLLFRRGLLLYSYIPSLIFLILITATVLAYLYQAKPLLVSSMLLLCILTFIFFMPFTYGLPLQEFHIKRRAWLPHWNPLSEEHVRHFIPAQHN
jgi:dolichyl-phosphate-mannose-protein mannosyltransferase